MSCPNTAERVYVRLALGFKRVVSQEGSCQAINYTRLKLGTFIIV